MKSEKITFTNARGITLSARLDQPDSGKARAYALFAHCFTCSKNLRAVETINQQLAAQGIAVLRLDFTGLGESAGDFADTTFSTNIRDLMDAATFLAQRYKAPTLLIGHSLGGAAVLQAATRLAFVQAVVTIGAPAEPRHVSHLFANSLEEIEASGEAKVKLADREFTIKKDFLDDLEARSMHSILGHLGAGLLVLHAPEDEIVSLENAERIYQQAVQPKSLVTLEGADHLLTRPKDAAYAGQIIAAWADRFLPVTAEGFSDEAEAEDRVTARIGTTPYATEIQSGVHHLLADEPEAIGGQDTGPAPYDLLAAALASCTAITLRMYADRKQWPVTSIEVDVQHDKIHASDCADCETMEGKIDQFSRTLHIEGNLTPAQRQRMVEIADNCPVHRTLENEVKVRTALRD